MTGNGRLVRLKALTMAVVFDINRDRKPYRTQDGYVCAMIYTDGHWKEFCLLVGREDLAKDPRFQGMANRLKNVEQYYGTLAEICATRTNAEWVALLKDSNVPHGPVNTLEFPAALTGVEARIIALGGKWFPTGAHKVGAAFGCLHRRNRGILVENTRDADRR